MKIHHFYLVILLLMGLCHGVSLVTSCTERGRFPNDENNDCRGYVMCLLGGISNFTQYKLTCPQGSIYSHLEQQCTNATNYKCYPSFNCTIVSNFINPESEDCSTYISCIQGMSDLATARLIQCADDTIFNSTSGECVDKNLSTCYTSIVKPVTRHPLDKPSTTDNDNIHIHKDVQSSNAVSNSLKVFPLVFICVIFIIE